LLERGLRAFPDISKQQFGSSLRRCWCDRSVIVIFMLAMLVVATVIPVMISPVVAFVIMPVSIAVSITTNIFVVVPIVANKIHGPPAGVVLRAVFVPVPLVARRYMQVDRFCRDVMG
jgi:hypothetical protein